MDAFELATASPEMAGGGRRSRAAFLNDKRDPECDHQVKYMDLSSLTPHCQFIFCDVQRRRDYFLAQMVLSSEQVWDLLRLLSGQNAV